MRTQPLLALMSATLTFTIAGAAGHHRSASASTGSGLAGGARAHLSGAIGSTAAASFRPRARESASSGLGGRFVHGDIVGVAAIRAAGRISLFGHPGISARWQLALRAVARHSSAVRGHLVYRPPGGVWLALRRCESGNDYAMNSGNGYYGAYQFALTTWQSIGFPGMPNEAPPQVQDRAAQVLQAQRGWSPWPMCSLYLGLG